MKRIYDESLQIAYLDGDSHLSQWVREAGKVKAERDPVCTTNTSYIRHGWWVIDAGAALGDHTTAYQEKVGASGRVLAFEPNPDYFDCLKYNCPQASCFNVALWDQAGTQRLDRKRTGNAGAFHLGEQDAGYIGNEDDGLMISTIALDDLLLPRLDFFKLDIEGTELIALRGSVETIKRCRPLIQCEVFVSALSRQGCSPEQLYQFIESMGYKIEFLRFPNDTAEGDHNKELLATPI